LDALMRRPFASHTTDAGLGLSLAGQSGMGGGVWATGGGSCFFAVDWAWDLRTCCDLEVAGEGAGGDGDCAVPEMLEIRVAERSALESITRSKAEDWKMRDCSMADVRMAICSQGLCSSGNAGFEPPHCIRLSVAVERS
jgi:hypothetical protein